MLSPRAGPNLPSSRRQVNMSGCQFEYIINAPVLDGYYRLQHYICYETCKTRW